ncbi:hypothetical protein [Dokdonia sp. Asnod1-B02]|uniref:hypothetical protein n=1 Tax=Dokdonia sp. Asnod1-B02 TaxID=3160573 RepID=UPI00386374FC
MRFLLLLFLTTSYLNAQNKFTQSGKLSNLYQVQLINYLNEYGLNVIPKDTLLIDLGTISSNIRNMTSGHYENYKALIASKSSIKHIEFIDKIPKRKRDLKKFKNQIIDQKSILKKIFFSSHDSTQEGNKTINANTVIVYPDRTFLIMPTDDIATTQSFLEKFTN